MTEYSEERHGPKSGDNLPDGIKSEINERVDDVIGKLVTESHLTEQAAAQLKPVLEETLFLLLQGQSSTFLTMTAHQGPLPHPAILQEYERLHPGTTKIFVESIKKDGETRRRNSTIHAVIGLTGQLIIFVIGMSGLYTGYKLAMAGKDAASISAIFTGLAFMLAAMLGRKIMNSDKERKE